jgi:CHRD domain
MRKTLLVVIGLVSFFAAAASAQTFVGAMTGANEAPTAGDTDGFGLAGFRFEGTSVRFAMMVKNIAAPNASHIHRGAVGVAGPVVITLASAYPDNVATGTASASPALIDEIRRNPAGFYVNVHNADFPNGAIRAQLSTGAFAFATGAQEIPGPGDNDGAGMAIFTLTGGGTTVNYTAMVQNIVAPSASHIHRGATVAGPVVITLASAYPDNMATGTASVPVNIVQELIENPANFYFNVHNADFGGGAIRGALQLEPFAETYYFPVVGHVDGVNNTRFVADVRAVNTSTSPVTLAMEFFASTPAGLQSASAVKGTLLAPGQEIVVNDVVASQFSATGLGALKLGPSSGMPTGVRVFNDLRPADGGTTGFFIRPKGISDAAASGTLLFLSQATDAQVQINDGFRTNIGWFNPNLGAAGASFQLHRASDGTVLGTADVVIAGLSQTQQAVYQLISSVPAADRAQEDFYVTWTSTVPIFVYAAVVDNKTGDVVYVD